MNNILMILIGIVTVITTMACAGSEEVFRATVCVFLLVLDVCMIFLASAAVIEIDDDDDNEEK